MLKVDEDGIMCPRIFCPANCRPFMAYAMSSNGIFEYARMSKDFKCVFMCLNRPEVWVYKTEWHYNHDELP